MCFMPLCVVIPWDSEEARQWEHRTGSLVPRTGMVASQRMVLEDSEVCGGEAHCSENQHKTPGVGGLLVCLSASSGPNQERTDWGLESWLSECLRVLVTKESQGSIPSIPTVAHIHL